MTENLLVDDKRQMLRLKRHLASNLAVLLFSLIGIHLYINGHYIIESYIIAFALATLWAGQILFFIIFITGRNLKYKDPSLTHAQMIWATIFILMSSYALKDMRVLMLMGYLGILSFGFFRLKPKQFITNAICTLSAYFFIIVYIYINEPLRIRIEPEFLQLVVFSVTCIILVYTGSAVSRLRDVSRLHTKELNDAVNLNLLLAITDDLTGLYTRSHFMDILKQQKARADREDNDFIILFADLDHFKLINDTYGHTTGDVVIERFAKIITRSIREVDYASRYGGEEFIVVLVNSDMESAKIVAERIRETIALFNFNDVAPGLHVTTSIGVAGYQEFKSIQETLQNSDSRMYKAKEAGRNSCVFE